MRYFLFSLLFTKRSGLNRNIGFALSRQLGLLDLLFWPVSFQYQKDDIEMTPFFNLMEPPRGEAISDAAPQ